MTIKATTSHIHWNYFLALERDLEVVSRYIEFTTANEAVFSIELAHLLFAAASEVDVIAKLICEQVSPGGPNANIKDYKAQLVPAFPDLADTWVFIPRYGLSFKPWLNWSGEGQPDWWRAYNNVKHERDSHFDEATLKNALNALGALLLLCFHYYSRKLADQPNSILAPQETTRRLLPQSQFMRLNEDWYYSVVIAG